MTKETLHYLISPSGEPVRLEKGKRFFVGRAEGNNITINDSLSSRWHLEIWWDGNNFIVQDLDSSNGTKLNGNDIKSGKLKDNDKIEVGLHSFVYREVETDEEVEKTRSTVVIEHRQQETQQFASVKSCLPPENDFSGVLSTVCIGDLCQLLSMSKRSGLLLVQLPEGKAMVYFVGGEVIQAEYANLLGDKAMLKILSEEEGHFSFKSGQKPLDKNVVSKLPHLLLESARLKDEEKR